MCLRVGNLSQADKDWSARPWEPTPQLLHKVVSLRKEVEQRVAKAEEEGRKPDGGKLLANAGRALNRLGFAAPSFDVDARLPAKPADEVMEVMKILPLCPYKGE